MQTCQTWNVVSRCFECFGDSNQSYNFLRPHCVMCRCIAMLGRRSVVDCGIRMDKVSGNMLTRQRTYEVGCSLEDFTGRNCPALFILLVKTMKIARGVRGVYSVSRATRLTWTCEQR